LAVHGEDAPVAIETFGEVYVELTKLSRAGDHGGQAGTQGWVDYNSEASISRPPSTASLGRGKRTSKVAPEVGGSVVTSTKVERFAG